MSGIGKGFGKHFMSVSVPEACCWHAQSLVYEQRAWNWEQVHLGSWPALPLVSDMLWVEPMTEALTWSF